MGTIYYVACKDCKIVRDLGKFYCAGGDIETREEMLKYSNEIKEKENLRFKNALLVSFMDKHFGHNCIFLNENNGSDFLYEEDEYEEDLDFWDIK